MSFYKRELNPIDEKEKGTSEAFAGLCCHCKYESALWWREEINQIINFEKAQLITTSV